MSDETPTRIQYRCRACALTFTNAETANAHHDATGHHQTSRCSVCSLPLSAHGDELADELHAQCMEQPPKPVGPPDSVIRPRFDSYPGQRIARMETDDLLAHAGEVIEAASDKLAKLCTGERWCMSVPVRDSDSDVALGALIRLALGLLARERARATSEGSNA